MFYRAYKCVRQKYVSQKYTLPDASSFDIKNFKSSITLTKELNLFSSASKYLSAPYLHKI